VKPLGACWSTAPSVISTVPATVVVTAVSTGSVSLTATPSAPVLTVPPPAPNSWLSCSPGTDGPPSVTV
jgi:hypothetical protein